MRKKCGFFVLILWAMIFVLAGCSDGGSGEPVREVRGSVSVFNESPQVDGQVTTIGTETVPIPGGDGYHATPPPLLGAEPGTVEDPTVLHTAESAAQAHRDTLNSLKAGLKDSPSQDLQELEAAQFVSFTDTINTVRWSLRDETTQSRTTQIQTNYYVWAAYSFDHKKDYYIIRQEVIIANGLLWGGKRDKYNFPAYYHSKDFWMNNLWTNNTLSKNGTSSPLNPNVLSISQYSPETINGTNTYTEGFSWSLGGKVGVTFPDGVPTPGAEINGGVNFSKTHIWSVQDIKTLAKVNDDLSTKNARWSWETQNRCTVSGTHFDGPADLATNTAKFGASWVWIVDRPGENDEYRINIDVGGAHSSTSFYATSADSSIRTYPWSFHHNFVLQRPLRTILTK